MFAHRLTKGKRKTIEEDPGGGPSGDVLRFADNEVASGEWSELSPGSGTLTRSNSDSFKNSWGMRVTGPANANSITRTWWHGLTSNNTFGTDFLAVPGDTRWLSGAFKFRSGDLHTWTEFMRLSRWQGGSTTESVFSCILAPGGMVVDCTDYSGNSGVPNVTYFSGVSVSRGVWHHIEVGIHVSHLTNTGWVELWMNGTQVGSRVTNRTIKLSTQAYQSAQFGHGNYFSPGTNGATETWFDYCKLATGRQGPS